MESIAEVSQIIPQEVVEQIVDVPVSQEAHGIYDTSFPSFMKRDVDICKDLYTNVVQSPAEVVDSRNSAEESPVSMQGPAPHAQNQASTATGHSSFEMSCSFTKQVAQHDLLILGRKPRPTRTMSTFRRKRSMDSGEFTPSCGR